MDPIIETEKPSPFRQVPGTDEVITTNAPSPFLPGGGSPTPGQVSEHMRLLQAGAVEDPEVNYTKGLQDPLVRFQWGQADNDEEREALLDKNFPGKWGTDRSGRYTVTTEGGERIAIDEKYLSKYDVADFMGENPSLIPAVLTGMALTSKGWLLAIGGTIIAGTAGEALDEVAEKFAGFQREKLSQWGPRAMVSGAMYGFLGEGAVRFLFRPVGRFLLGPSRRPPKHMFTKESMITGQKPKPTGPPRSRKLVQETLILGDREKWLELHRLQGQINPAPEVAVRIKSLKKELRGTGARITMFKAGGSTVALLGRLQGMADSILGNPREAMNARAILREMGNIISKSGREPFAKGLRTVSEGVTGRVKKRAVELANIHTVAMKELESAMSKISNSLSKFRSGRIDSDVMKAHLSEARAKLRDLSEAEYGIVDELFGNQPYLYVGGVRDTAKKILGEFPRNQQGNIILPPGQGLDFLRLLSSLQEYSTASEMQVLRSAILSGGKNKDLVAAFSDANRYKIISEINKSFDNFGSKLPKPLLQRETAPYITKGLGGGKKGEVIPKAGYAETEIPYTRTVEELQAGVVAMQRTNSWYKSQISKFEDFSVARVARDISIPGAVEAENVAYYIARPGQYRRAARFKRSLYLRDIKGDIINKAQADDLWKKVGESLTGKILDASRGVDDLIDGKKFLGQVKKMGKTLDVVIGKTEATELRKRAAEFAAVGGKIDPSALEKGNIQSLLVREIAAKKQLDDFTSASFLDKLQAGDFEPTAIVDWVLTKNGVERVKTLKNFLGEGSKEWLDLRQKTMQRILNTMFTKNDDGITKVISGGSLRETLESFGGDSLVLQEIFGAKLYRDLTRYSRTISFITEGPAISSGIVAANIALNATKNLGVIGRVWVLSKLFSTTNALKLMSEGWAAPKTRFMSDQISRMVLDVMATMPEGLKERLQPEE
jgi:hypothetical protein